MRKFLFITALLLCVTSCSPKVVGTWNIDRYEVENQKGQNFSTSNAGKITIKKNGTGEKTVEYNMFQNEFNDLEDFRWKMPSEDIITITSKNSKKKSDLDKTWIIVTNKNDKQVWKSTDGRNAVQILELSKD